MAIAVQNDNVETCLIVAAVGFAVKLDIKIDGKTSSAIKCGELRVK